MGVFWGSGSLQGTSADTHVPSAPKLILSDHVKPSGIKVSWVCYRCSGGRSGGREAWPHHGHHRSSGTCCPRLTQRQEEKLTLRYSVCSLQDVLGHNTVHQCPVMSRLVVWHYWIGLNWQSYHAEAGVSPQKRRDTHGYGLKVWRGGRGGFWDIKLRHKTDADTLQNKRINEKRNVDSKHGTTKTSNLSSTFKPFVYAEHAQGVGKRVARSLQLKASEQLSKNNWTSGRGGGGHLAWTLTSLKNKKLKTRSCFQATVSYCGAVL